MNSCLVRYLLTVSGTGLTCVVGLNTLHHAHSQAVMPGCCWSPDFPLTLMNLTCHGKLSHLCQITAEALLHVHGRHCLLSKVDLYFIHTHIHLFILFIYLFQELCFCSSSSDRLFLYSTCFYSIFFRPFSTF
jgi:hypothetical protein